MMVRILGEDDGTDTAQDVGEPSPNGDQPPGEEAPKWDAIFDAPDYASLITSRQTAKARSYTIKVNSVLKAATIASINTGDLPDAAALLHYGPPFSHAAGQLADQNERVAQAIDLLTSPSSPVVMFALTSISLVSQILRNHEAQLAEIPNARKRAKAERKARRATGHTGPPRFTIRILGRKWPIYMRTPKWSRVFSGFRAQTQPPDALTFRVFSDERVQAALVKQGIKLVRRETPE